MIFCYCAWRRVKATWKKVLNGGHSFRLLAKKSANRFNIVMTGLINAVGDGAGDIKVPLPDETGMRVHWYWQ